MKLIRKNFIKILIASCIVSLICIYFLIIAGPNYSSITAFRNNNLIVHYIDVGQGDSILVECDGQNILIDTGPSDSSSKLVKYLKGMKIKNINALILTHPHEDHIGGALKVLKNFNVSKIYGSRAKSLTPTFKELAKYIIKKGKKITVLKGSYDININNVKMHVICPLENNYKNLNDYSLVINMEYGNFNFLFTGDMENTEEKEFLKHYTPSDKTTILKVPHHGSSTTSSNEFLNLTKPSISIISCGIYNSYGHPHKATLERLKKINCKILRTDLDSNIILICNGKSIKQEIIN